MTVSLNTVVCILFVYLCFGCCSLVDSYVKHQRRSASNENGAKSDSSTEPKHCER